MGNYVPTLHHLTFIKLSKFEKNEMKKMKENWMYPVLLYVAACLFSSSLDDSPTPRFNIKSMSRRTAVTHTHLF